MTPIARGQHSGYWYLVTPLAAGGNLSTWLEAGRTDREILETFRELAAAIADLHSAGIVHGDIKPSNVLFETDSSMPILADFGSSAGPEVLTISVPTTGPIGTFAYASPEQLAGTVDKRSDIYAFGRSLLEALNPAAFKSLNPATSFDEPAHDRWLQAATDEATEPIRSLVRACSSWSADDRPQSGAELLRWFDAASPGAVRHGRLSRYARRGRSAVTRHWRIASLAVAAMAVAASGVAFGLRPSNATAGVDPAACNDFDFRFAAQAGATGQLETSWDARDDCYVGYIVTYSTRNDLVSAPFDQKLDASNRDRMSLSGLEVGTEVFVWLEGYAPGVRNQIGWAFASPAESCEHAPPPKGLRVGAMTPGAVELEWTSGGGCTTTFYVYYSDQDDIFTVEGGRSEKTGIIDVSNVTRYVVAQLRPGTGYWFWVISSGPGDSSSETWAGSVSAHVPY
jgi:hypothetical protein